MLWVTIARYSHAGKVCSGDYLYQNPTEWELYSLYMIKAGTWLEFYAMGSWIITIIMVTILGVSEAQRIDLLPLVNEKSH